MNVIAPTPTPKDVSYLSDINKSRLVIDDLELLPEGLKNKDWQGIKDWHEDRIRFYLDLLNKHLTK